MSLIRSIIDFLSVEERVAPPPVRRAPDACATCKHWIGPDALTTKVVPSARAIAWAKDGGFGRCTAPSAGTHERGETKRFTLPNDSCGQYAKKVTAAG